MKVFDKSHHKRLLVVHEPKLYNACIGPSWEKWIKSLLEKKKTVIVNGVSSTGRKSHVIFLNGQFWVRFSLF